eukprot:scaffold1645_cov288-Pavlova_lutheri.AAC.12
MASTARIRRSNENRRPRGLVADQERQSDGSCLSRRTPRPTRVSRSVVSQVRRGSNFKPPPSPRQDDPQRCG